MKTKLKTGDQKEFQNDFETLCRTRPRWEAWSDFIHLSAYAISNAVDAIHREHREAEYLKIAKRYTAAEMEAVSRLLSTTVLALEKNPDQDFLGDLYMQLELGNSHVGQFFTPYHVGKMMALNNVDDAMSGVEREGYISVNDCCVGGGALLIAFANACKEKGLNYQQSVLFVAQDIDHTVGMMAYIQLSLMGCPGYVVIGNSLTQPLTGNPLIAPMDRETYVTPFYCADTWRFRRMAWLLRSLCSTREQTDVKANEIPAQPEETFSKPIQLSIFDL